MKLNCILKYSNGIRHTYCCNLSGGVALIVWFTTNGMRAKNKNICMWREQAIIEWSRWSDLGEWPLIMLVNSWLCLVTVTTRVISSGDLYCCLLPRCEALRTCRSGFPIATVFDQTRSHNFLRANDKRVCRCKYLMPFNFKISFVKDSFAWRFFMNNCFQISTAK